VTSNKNPSKKCLQIFPMKKPRKGSENNKKGKIRGTQSSLAEPHRIIIHTKNGSYKV
jgi:hypothetical protein